MDVPKLSVELDRALRRKVVNQRFKLLQSIGQGQFGKVLLAEDLAQGHGHHVAIKTIHRVDTTRLITKTYLSHTTKIKREIQIMKECDHPNVVKLFQVIDDMHFDKILLVLEYCALGEIDWKRYNHYHEKYFKSKDRRLLLNRILRDVANGLEYLHQFKHIIHRDLKPLNLLISSDRTIKISDFGVSLILENNANDDRELGKTMGTPAFFAPELCQFVNNRLLMFNEHDLRRSKIDARVDLWSLGVTLYCLFFHQLPFEGFNEFGLFKNIVNAELVFPRTKRSSLAKPEDLKELALLEDLISKLLKKDPQLRPTIAEIKAHGFTTFDLSKIDAEKFRNANRQIILKQSLAAAEAFAAETKLSLRLRKLFVGRSEAALAAKTERPLGLLPVLANADAREQRINARELEKVDDLLDSYLDDSSSFGSLEDDTEPAVVETADLFDALLIDVSDEPQAQSSKNGSLESLAADSRKVPPPLSLVSSNFDLTQKNSPLLQDPGSPHPVVTIGPDSPLSLKSVFSPSRRFFARFKKKTTEPTISALSGHMTEDQGISYNWAPPPAFGDGWKKPKSNRSLVASTDSMTASRKNSVSSTSSNMMSKISSSSSSLNLHAYLMNDPSDDVLDEGTKRRDEHGTASEESSNEDADRTMSMDQFLDRLEQ